jgi:hypothetical protein
MKRAMLSDFLEMTESKFWRQFLDPVNPVKRRQSQQGCQMVYFQTKNPNLGKFWRAIEGEGLVYSMAIWNTLLPFGTFYGHLVI